MDGQRSRSAHKSHHKVNRKQFSSSPNLRSSPSVEQRATKNKLARVASHNNVSKDGKTLSREQANGLYSQFLKKTKSEFEKKWAQNPQYEHVKWTDFEKGRTLGTGSFGRVVLAKYKPAKPEKFFAVKILNKCQVVQQKQVGHTINEKKIMACVSFPFLTRMSFAFKDNCHLFMAMQFVAGGEMFYHLRETGTFDEGRTRFYGSQVMMAFEYLHNLELVYRDLKPENLLIDYKGYVKVTDFGFCKRITGRTWTMCGTPEYLPPEIILSKGYGKGVDWWSFGILLYEMSAGYPPFTADRHIDMYEKIVVGRYKFPSYFSLELKDLIHHLLQVDVTKRYGMLKSGVKDIKNHKFFQSVDYIATYRKELPAPFVPKLTGPGDDSNFEKYDEADLETSSKCLYEEEFKDF